MSRRFWEVCAAALVVVALSGQNSSAVGTTDEQWIPNMSSADGYQGFLLQDPADRGAFSYLAGFNGSNGLVCSSTDSGDCKSSQTFSFNSELKVCATPSQMDCIVSLSAVDADGNVHPATFLNYTWDHHINEYQADPAHGLPDDGAPSVWEIPGVSHSSGDQYLLEASLQGGGPRNAITSTGLSINLFATSLYIDSNYPVSSANTSTQDWMRSLQVGTNPDGTTRVYGFGPLNLPNVKCASFTGTPGQCEAPEVLPMEYSFKVDLRLSKEPTGWLHGRLDQPSVQIQHQSRSVELIVTGRALKVPTVFYGDQFSSLPNSIQTLYSMCGTWPTCSQGASSSQPDAPGAGKKANPLTRNIVSVPNPWGLNTVTELNQWLPIVKNRATASPTEWSIHTLSEDQLANVNSCFTSISGVDGIVTTNASAYSEGPPTFSNGTLTYQVAAPHFLNDQSVFKGMYNLIIKSEVAKCLYKFSNAPVSATIQVTDSNGSENLATTTFNERDGWDYLSANNFQFSAPTIKIQLRQAGAPKAFICVKGKTKLLLKTSQKKCPAGYIAR